MPLLYVSNFWHVDLESDESKDSDSLHIWPLFISYVNCSVLLLKGQMLSQEVSH